MILNWLGKRERSMGAGFTHTRRRHPWMWVGVCVLLLGVSCGKKKEEASDKPVEEFSEKKLEQALMNRRMAQDRALSDLSPGLRLPALASLLHSLDKGVLEEDLIGSIPSGHCFRGKDWGVVVGIGETFSALTVSRIPETLAAYQDEMAGMTCVPLKGHLAETLFLMSTLAERQWWLDASQGLKQQACALGAERACPGRALRSVVKPAPGLAKAENRVTDPQDHWVITELTRSHVSVDGKSILQTGGADPKTRCALVSKMTTRYEEIARREREEAEEMFQPPRDPVVLTVVEGDVTDPRACFYLAATRLAAEEGWKRGILGEQAVVPKAPVKEVRVKQPLETPKSELSKSKLPSGNRRMVKKVRAENVSLTAMLERRDTAVEKEEPIQEEVDKPRIQPLPVEKLKDDFEQKMSRYIRNFHLSIFTATSFQIGGRVRYISGGDVFPQWCMGQMEGEVKSLRTICAAQ